MNNYYAWCLIHNNSAHMSRTKTDEQLRNLKRRFFIRIKIAEIDLLFHLQYSAAARFGLDNADHNFSFTKYFESDLVRSETHPKIWQQL